MSEPLKGIKIISFNHFLLGPLGVQHLADLGADVIAVEPLTGSFQRKFGGYGVEIDGEGALFHFAGRNKRNLSIDLKKNEGVEILLHMVKEVDVVAENFRPGVMDSLGLGWEKLSKINTKLIYAASTGFGNDGPSYKEPGQDLLIQAISGLATINGSESTGPRPVGVSVVDHHGAALYAMAILTGLVNRSVTGKGLRVDVDLLSAAIDLQAESLFYYLNGEKKDSLLSKDNVAGWHNVSPYGLYSTKNGHIVVSLASLEVLTEALEMDINFLENSDAKTNINNENIGSKLQSRFNELSTENACSRLKNKKIWHAKVADYEELIENPQVKHNGILLKTKSAANNAFTAILNPIRIDGKRPGVRIPPQPLGAQTREILLEYGFPASEIKKYEKMNIIKCS